MPKYDWDKVRPDIERLYRDEGKGMSDVANILATTRGFRAKLTPPVLAPPLFWNILYYSRQLAHRHFNNALLTHFFSNLLHLFNVLSPLI